ncbi:DJ-1/PfpI family protein [Paenibacillus rigui]|uniref:Thiamine biosynthesis protein ThiJ n=1 Tax=Paenibacillus rigui TaxID=554312 RepID=A0A229UY05_9BACL|nr:DJ-1/PfpI family protein [Paenibacillus rigui]OXM88243.1 thiamine biosynthesis protein ThiJ [Paenibacillus rigui]
MKIAFVLFDQVTLLDFIGFYDAMTRLKSLQLMEEVSWDLCGLTEEVSDEAGVMLKINRVRPNLSEYDVVYVPGGRGTRRLKGDPQFISWLQTAAQAKYKISVCTGAHLLGVAGYLEGRRATTIASAFESLLPYCEEVLDERIVKDGDVVTAGGVATSLDLGLFMIEYWLGPYAAQKVQDEMDYPYYVTRKYIV